MTGCSKLRYVPDLKGAGPESVSQHRSAVVLLRFGNELIGVGRALAPPPSEPDRRYLRIRLSS